MDERDRETRRKFAQLMRQFVSGRMTNHEFDSAFEMLDRDADGVLEVWADGAWGLYDDLQSHRMTDDAWRLSRKGRREVARWVLFLQTDLPYEWPDRSPLREALQRLVMWITGGRVRFYGARQEDYGDMDTWPFLRRADFEAARRRPRLLCGKAGTA